MNNILKINNKPLYFSLTVFFVATYLLRGTSFSILSSHITNFSVTGSLLCISLYSDLHKGKLSQRSLYMALIFWTFVNLVMELFVRVGTIHLFFVSFVNFNTPDPVDAIFGIVSIIIYYFVLRRYCSVKTN